MGNGKTPRTGSVEQTKGIRLITNHDSYCVVIEDLQTARHFVIGLH